MYNLGNESCAICRILRNYEQSADLALTLRGEFGILNKNNLYGFNLRPRQDK